jgi:hypothetical protein
MNNDECRQKFVQAVAAEGTRQGVYEVPRVVQLGRSRDLIRGNFAYGRLGLHANHA